MTDTTNPNRERTGMTVIVEAGDTLSGIAERVVGRASAWPMLAKVNRLANPHLIVPGQRINIPAGTR